MVLVLRFFSIRKYTTISAVKMSLDSSHPEAVCIRITTMERYVYLWTIKELASYLKNKLSTPITKKISMPNCDMEWLLNFYPSDFKLEHRKCHCKSQCMKHYTRLRADLIRSKVSGSIVEGKFQILDKHDLRIGPVSPTQTLHADAIEIELPTKQTLLENLPNDMLKLQLEMRVTVPVQKVSETRSFTDVCIPCVPQTKECIDALVVIGNTVIPTHQCVLARNSSVFATMLDKDDHCLKHIELSDVDAETTNILINFIYNQQTPDFHTLDEQRLVKVLEAACKYVVYDLKALTSDYLMTNLTSSNVLDILLLADAYDIKELKEKTIKYICTNKHDFPSIGEKKCFEGKSELVAKVLLESFKE